MNSEADYRAGQKACLDSGRRAYPHLEWPAPWRYEGPPLRLFVNGGVWKVECMTPECGNYPVVSLDWRLALCWSCGAIYEDLVVPEDAAEVERILVHRPLLRMRNWNWPEVESVEDLRAQNRAQGDRD